MNSFAEWKAGLEALGYRIAQHSTQGSSLFVKDGKPSYRVSEYEPNEATALWLARTGIEDARCLPLDGDEYFAGFSDLPEFGPTEPQYRIIDVIQGSDEWDQLRARPTASNFGRIVSPARGDYSDQATAYAAEIVAKRLGVYTESPPSFWMTWGTEHEPLALASYEESNEVHVRKVGFIVPLHTDAYGGSPDGLVGNAGMLEIKCPKPETLIKWISAGVLPDEHRPQVQGNMMISRLPWCDFYAWHPELTPFQIRVYADDAYQTKIATGIYRLLAEVERLEASVGRQNNVNMTAEEAEEQELDHYESTDIQL